MLAKNIWGEIRVLNAFKQINDFWWRAGWKNVRDGNIN